MQLRFTKEAQQVLKDLERPQYRVKLKKVRKALALLETNPRHPGLNTHKLQSVKSSDGAEVWDSYVENKTPGAWRLYWRYGPGDSVITVVTIGPHPD